jgi:hypothetical protein
VLEFVFVRVSVWFAMIAWFLGAIDRAGSKSNEPSGTARERKNRDRVYRVSWFAGSLFMLIHIVASYGLVHHWSHSAALEQTAQESFRVTGIRAGWGVYVNFLFAGIWFIYSVTMMMMQRRIGGLDVPIFYFLLAIVTAATVVFEAGPIRYLALTGLLILTLQSLLKG